TFGHPGDAGEVVVQAAPQSGVDDFPAEIGRPQEVATGVEVTGCTRGIEAVDRDVDPARPEESRQYLGQSGCDRTVRGRILRVVRRRHERPPAGLFDGRGIPVVET